MTIGRDLLVDLGFKCDYRSGFACKSGVIIKMYQKRYNQDVSEKIDKELNTNLNVRFTNRSGWFHDCTV